MASDKSPTDTDPSSNPKSSEPRSSMLMPFIYDTSSLQERLWRGAPTDNAATGATIESHTATENKNEPDDRDAHDLQTSKKSTS
ncbi:hypothetical protein F66182_2919 [Fusarium sp. NRRL 66182]|nr:hypothetical protein F66182_2919 [Fusarium sp. NRRL 66182]